ncbi:MAG TPA: glycosyltransferase family 4 protein [Candidatus Limnocylindria bacterium]|nr:glycosyltransferase family 4 protein [Candidatus Limnocylindria bacterium]
MTTVHQFHPVVAAGDAMGDHILTLGRYLREWGHDARAYAVEAADGEVLPYRRLFREARPEDVVILHFSMGHEVFDQLAKLPGRKVLVYHNVTPPEFFAGINPHAAAHAALGRRQLASLAPKIDLAIGVSEYDRAELEDAGFASTAHVPILIDWSKYDVEPDPGVLASQTGPGARILFVGRISPNKRQDHLIRLLAYYTRCIDPDARLVLAGGYRDQARYHARCLALARELGLRDAVTFTGKVPLPALVAYYRTASVFVSLSEHEGFGVPLLEAMRLRAPVVAYSAAAVPETVDGAAILLDRKDLAEAAEAAAIVVEREDVRARLVAAGERRVADFATERVAAETRRILEL